MGAISNIVRLYATEPGFRLDQLNYRDCPECGGKGKLMVAAREDGPGLWYKCLKARCQLSGVTHRVERGPATQPKAVKPPDQLPESAVTSDDARSILRVTMEARKGVRMSEEWALEVCSGMTQGDRFIFPICGPQGYRIGSTLRSFVQQPKTISLWHDRAEPRLAWYRGLSETLTVVEDQLSASRLAAEGFRSVALLGTSPSEDAIDQINATARRLRTSVLICLDNDATDKAVALRRKLTSGTVLPLVGLDIKDMPDAQFYQFLRFLKGVE